jgi:hypothetical protein
VYNMYCHHPPLEEARPGGTQDGQVSPSATATATSMRNVYMSMPYMYITSLVYF